MNYAQIKSFHAVLKFGSYSRAADFLGVSQPAVSSQIKLLEEKVGKPLFMRKGGRLALTEAGRSLMYSASQIIALMEDLEFKISSNRALRSGHITIGITSPYFLKTIAAFVRKFPDIELEILLGNTDTMVDHLKNFRVDVALVTQIHPDERFYNHRFFEQRIIACLPQGHPWSNKKAIGLAELCSAPLVYREKGSMTQYVFERALADHGLAPRVILRVSTREAVKEAVASGIGLGFVFDVEFGCDKRIQAVPIRRADLRAWQHVVCVPKFKQTKWVRELVNTADGCAS
jgi:aminoethylphosphonate catabolism LysR family transcriptional regulator